jgi:hypothetical protein
MAKINLTASTYRVARGKAEIAREERWLKRAQLTTKKRRESKTREPEEKRIDQSGERDRNKAAGAGDPGSLDRGEAVEQKEPEAPDDNKER